MSDASEQPAPVVEVGQSAERFKAFCDAVIAIAMTLLILPLMEAVGEARRLTTLEFLQEHIGQLSTFLLSFALIAVFWLQHHQVFDGVERVTRRLISLNLLWLLMIVWLPVATAMIGQMDSDPLLAVVYVGTLIVATVLLIVMRLTLLRHPELTTAKPEAIVAGISANVALTVWFVITLVCSIIWPGYGMLGFLLCMLTGPSIPLFYRLIAPRLGVRVPYRRAKHR